MWLTGLKAPTNYLIHSGQHHFARHSERGKKTRQREEEAGRKHRGMGRPGFRQVPESSGGQRQMEEIACKIICGAPTTTAVKGWVKVEVNYSGFLTSEQINSHPWLNQPTNHQHHHRHHHHHLIIIIITYPLTKRVVGAPQMISQPASSILPCSPLPSGTCQNPGLSIP